MRLIDADELKDRLQNLIDDKWNKATSTTWSIAYSDAAEIVENAPTIEVEPIVRCKDCADWVRNFTDRAKPNVHPCRAVGHPTTADFFCGLGERMDGGNNDSD